MHYTEAFEEPFFPFVVFRKTFVLGARASLEKVFSVWTILKLSSNLDLYSFSYCFLCFNCDIQKLFWTGTIILIDKYETAYIISLLFFRKLWELGAGASLENNCLIGFTSKFEMYIYLIEV